MSIEPHDMLEHGSRGDPICIKTRSSHCSGPLRWISIQQGVLVIVCRLTTNKLRNISRLNVMTDESNWQMWLIYSAVIQVLSSDEARWSQQKAKEEEQLSKLEFTSHLTQNRSFWKWSFQAISCRDSNNQTTKIAKKTQKPSSIKTYTTTISKLLKWN